MCSQFPDKRSILAIAANEYIIWFNRKDVDTINSIIMISELTNRVILLNYICGFSTILIVVTLVHQLHLLFIHFNNIKVVIILIGS